MENCVELAGASGVIYYYEASTIDAPWSDVAGNYAFASPIESEQWRILYVGETSSLRECLSSHDLWPEAVSSGCTHVLAHVNDGGDQARELEERDLVEGLAPPMNRSRHDPLARTWT
ncbi:MAG: hypothetical protein H7840_12100 [Alphaproteobacteria bacterium]